ncbi:MAG: hypothetical protein PHR35_17145, partial [Kiritimatiellae bacterium]|nr:hypothetical protein [Kiritimatiellia bacterium]
MNMTINSFYFAAILAMATAATGLRAMAAGVTLVENGQPRATIVLAERPTRAAQLAAYELQYHIRKITGVDLPMAAETQPATGARVLVGESAATRELGLKSADFAPQEYLIAFRPTGPTSPTAPNTLVLIGRDKADTNRVDYASGNGFLDLFDEQGTLYAAYDFLERFCGVRWYLPTDLGITYTERGTLEVQGKDVRRSPDMKFRSVSPVYRIP